MLTAILSDTVYIRRGLYQDSPLQPTLFLLTAHGFTTNIKQNPAIEGIKVDNVPLLQSLFADDTDLYLKVSESFVDAVLRELKRFGDLSGCKINIDKTLSNMHTTWKVLSKE